METQRPREKEIIADDQREGLGLLLRLRVPWLVLGLFGGAVTAVFVSRFEKVISENIALAFFLPLIVYMSDAVGTQTEAIYVRNLVREKIRLRSYVIKETSLGIVLGLAFGILLGLFAFFWLGDSSVAFTVGLAMAVNVAVAPIIALLIAVFFHKEHTDPAVGAGPSTTVIQDFVSLFIYFAISSLILFN